MTSHTYTIKPLLGVGAAGFGRARLLLYAPFTSTLKPNARDHIESQPHVGYPSDGSWFLVPVVCFLLSVSLFSTHPKVPPTAQHDPEGHHTMEHPVARSGHLFKYLAIPWPTSSTTRPSNKSASYIFVS